MTLLLVLALAVPAPQTAARPLLRVSDTTPLVVRGAGFRPLERLKVTVIMPVAATRATRATRGGRFVVRFGVSIGRCDDLELRARGSRGSRASLTLYAPDCAEP